MTDGGGFEDFYLDTKNMDAIITKMEQIAKLMEQVKQDYRQQVTDLTVQWVGRSRTMFDKKSAQLIQTLTDVSQSFFDIREDLLAASEAYMQADTNLAKNADGMTSRY